MEFTIFNLEFFLNLFITASPKLRSFRVGMQAKKGFKLPFDASEAVESFNKENRDFLSRGSL